MRYLLVLLLAGCLSNPPIDRQGNNCEVYGVSEEQNSPIAGPMEPDGWPAVEIVTNDQLKGLCGNRGFWDRWSYGCVDIVTGKAYAHKNPQTVNHERCHRLLGTRHSRQMPHRFNHRLFR